MNKFKLVYGQELGKKVVELGFIPVQIRADRYKEDLVYVFENSYALRLAIRNIVK